MNYLKHLRAYVGIIKRSFVDSTPVYHGSPYLLETITPQNQHGDPYIGGAQVFASDFPAFALCYSGGKWGDRDINQSAKYKKGNPIIEITEMRPGAIEEIYDQLGYLYTLPRKGFTYRNKHESIKPSYAEPTGMKIIQNVKKALEDNGVIFHRYDPTSERYLSAVKRMATRLKKFEPRYARGYIKWIAEGNPQLAQDILDYLSRRGISEMSVSGKDRKEAIFLHG